MNGYDSATYGDRIAEVYDEWYTSCDPAMIDTLVALAGGGRALELGIGTGRVALPLSERGVEMHGVDASASMVARLREKDGGAEIPVTVAAFAEFEAGARFSLAYVVFNTFFGLLSQEAQVRCFRTVARHLDEGGVFLIEAFVPDPTLFHRGQAALATQVGADGVKLDLSRHDPVEQRSMTQHVVITEAGVRLYPVEVRYAWPAELDLMARLAGLRLRHRWSGWRHEPFSAASTQHVSVYGKGTDG